MNERSIPINVQLEAVAHRKVAEMIKDYVDNSQGKDPRQFLTITEKQLTDYLNRHVDIAKGYLISSKNLKPYNDKEVVEEKNGKYLVYWMDHGKPRDVEEFESLSKAAARYLMMCYGL